MSTLVFDGDQHTITLFDANNHQIGQWPANNRVARSATMRFVPNGAHGVVDPQMPHTHGNDSDTINQAYGRFGIIRLEPFTIDGVNHEGVGIHAGRDNSGAQNHPTMGCIRTTDQAMQAITQFILGDPLTGVQVQNNHDQNTVPSPHPADHHRRHHRHHHQHPAPAASPTPTPTPTPPAVTNTPMT